MPDSIENGLQNKDQMLTFVEGSSNDDSLEKSRKSWKVLIVDDEPEVHDMTRLVLKQYTYLDKKLEFLSAHSAAESRELFQKNPDIALILLDVVMEENDSGLKLIQFIRNELNNHGVRIILRTGEPGFAPEEKVILDYDINDYKEKSELTNTKLFTTVTTALRNFHDFQVIQDNSRMLQHYSEQLRDAYNRLGKLDDAKLQILKFLSHEINTPLNAIGASQVFNTTTMTAQNQKILNIVETGFNRLSGLVRAVINYFELAGKEIIINRTAFGLREVIEESFGKIREDHLKKEPQLELAIHNCPEIDADLGYFRQVMEIVIENAIKFSGDGATISITVERAGNGKVRIVVTDQGIGISPENGTLIFQAFSLGQHERNAEGYGLNLPTAKLLIEAQGGKIWAESSGVHQGAKFFIEI